MNLKEARLAAGMSQEQAAQHLNVGLTTIWRYESGKTRRKDHDLVERMKQLYAERTASAAC